MRDYVSWATTITRCEVEIKKISDLMESRKPRDAMKAAAEAQILLAEFQHWVLTQKK